MKWKFQICRGELFFKNERGQTLVEVLLASGVTVILLVSMIAVVTRSIADSQFSKNKTKAARYVEEGLELARFQRDEANWDDFSSVTASPLPSPFTRTISVTDESTDEVERKKIEVLVDWSDGKGDHQSKGVGYLMKWE